MNDRERFNAITQEIAALADELTVHPPAELIELLKALIRVMMLTDERTCLAMGALTDRLTALERKVGMINVATLALSN